MGQRSNDTYVAVKDAQTNLRKEECALGMEQSSNDAVVKDVQSLLTKEECAFDMGQRSRSNVAASKGAQIKSFREDCALGMVQIRNGAEMKDAKTK